MSLKNIQDLQQRVVRRNSLIEKIVAQHPDKQGSILLCASFEQEREPFFQDSSFSYFVGINEPALVFYQELVGRTILYEPQYKTDRTVWLPTQKNQATLAAIGITEEQFLGDAHRGYSGKEFTRFDDLGGVEVAFEGDS